MKKLSIAALLIVLFSMTAVAANAGGARNMPPVANDDEVILLYRPATTVDIPVLDNDFDPEGRDLRVTGLLQSEGSKAEVVGGKFVRVTVDWSAVDKNPTGLVAHGVYLVSDGQAQSKGEWFVYYWPEMLP